jgi:hypothetical protein
MSKPEGEIRNFIDENSPFIKRAAGIATILEYLKNEGLVETDWEDKKAVELGCGAGSGLWLFSTILGADVTGVDDNRWPNIDYWNKASIVNDIPSKIDTSMGYLKKVESESLDAIFAFDAVSDVWTQEVSEEAYRALGSGGLVLITWQHVNLTSGDGKWPKGWPAWKGWESIVELSDSKYKREKKFKDFLVDPKAIAKGIVAVNNSLVSDNLIFPEKFAMVGRK